MGSLLANPETLLNQQPIQSPQVQGGTEVSRRNPQPTPFDQKLQQLQVSRESINKALQVRRELKESWAMQRRLKIRETLKAIEYGKGNQFIVLDPYTDAYYNPFVS